MSDDIRENLPTLVAVTLIGIATCAFALMQVFSNASSFNISTFSLAIFVIPAVIMLIGSFIIVLTSQRIGRKLYVAIVAICLVLGIVVMVATSIWITDPTIVAQLQANSPEGMPVTPPTNSPLIVMRDIAAFVVCPTIGCIAGAWIGSRLHPVTSETPSKRKSKKKPAGKR